MVASFIGSSKEVYVYDSVYDLVDEETEGLINALFCSTNVVMKKCQKQKGGMDCGLFAEANAKALALGIDSCNIHFYQELMRNYLHKCFAEEVMKLFPFKVVVRGPVGLVLDGKILV